MPGSFIEREGTHPDLYTNDKMEQTTHLAKGSQTNERPRPVTMRHFLKILNAHVEAYLRYAFQSAMSKQEARRMYRFFKHLILDRGIRCPHQLLSQRGRRENHLASQR